jgi:thiosulfate/3-mercaptopyruvate sulfurtransferase
VDTLVDTAWLAGQLAEPDLVVLDCTVTFRPGGGFGDTVSGRAEYEAGHIPGAGFADLTTELCDTDAPIQFAVPSPEAFCAAMGALGVGDDSRVVLYDTSFAAWAARVWWMLRWVGFDRAALLDGGLRAWLVEDRAVSTGDVQLSPETLTPNVRPELIADRDEVRSAVDDGAISLLDTLPAEHFRGNFAMYDRPGHIPGAANVSALALLDESGRFLSADRLAELHPGDSGERTITYCGGGIAASSNAFVMTRLGFEDVAVYTASLQEWAADPDNPMVVGE